jgi:hypothetical protein
MLDLKAVKVQLCTTFLLLKLIAVKVSQSKYSHPKIDNHSNIAFIGIAQEDYSLILDSPNNGLGSPTPVCNCRIRAIFR